MTLAGESALDGGRLLFRLARLLFLYFRKGQRDDASLSAWPPVRNSSLDGNLLLNTRPPGSSRKRRSLPRVGGFEVPEMYWHEQLSCNVDQLQQYQLRHAVRVQSYRLFLQDKQSANRLHGYRNIQKLRKGVMVATLLSLER